MDDAFDTFRSQRVRAAIASSSHFPGRYLCPVCQTEVTHVEGDFQAAHFRHLPGTDHEECERYAQNFHRDVPLAKHEFEHLDAVLVALHTQGASGASVSFAVRFRPAYKAGFVNFISGKESTPYTIHPGLRQQYFTVTSAEKNYLVKAQLGGRQRELHIVEGFDGNPAVFRAADGEAVRIPNHRILKPGEYIAVTRKPIRNFHSALGAEQLQTITGLHAILIRIPENPNYPVRENIRSLLHFEITTRMAVYGFLSPTNVYELAPDSWEVSRDAELAISVRVTREDSPRYTRLLIQHRLSGHLETDYLTWPDNADEFVIQFKQPGKLDLLRIGLATSITAGVWFLLEINFSEDPVSPQSSRIQFQFGSATNDKVRFKWSAHELPRMLLAAVRDVTKLSSITHIPPAVQISASDSRGQRVQIPETGSAEALLTFLRQARFPCILSATAHPNITLMRESSPIQQPTALTAHLSALPRSRKEFRLRNANKRGLVSKYSLRAVAI